MWPRPGWPPGTAAPLILCFTRMGPHRVFGSSRPRWSRPRTRYLAGAERRGSRTADAGRARRAGRSAADGRRSPRDVGAMPRRAGPPRPAPAGPKEQRNTWPGSRSRLVRTPGGTDSVDRTTGHPGGPPETVPRGVGTGARTVQQIALTNVNAELTPGPAAPAGTAREPRSGRRTSTPKPGVTVLPPGVTVLRLPAHPPATHPPATPPAVVPSPRGPPEAPPGPPGAPPHPMPPAPPAEPAAAVRAVPAVPAVPRSTTRPGTSATT